MTETVKVLLPDYDELTEKQNTFNKNKTFIESSSENISNTEAKIKSLTDEIVTLTDESKCLEKIGEEKLKLETEKKKQQEEKTKLEKLDKDIDNLVELCLKSVKAHRDYTKKYFEADTLDDELKEKTRIYLEAQAGILAETLEANKPCPVCGSTSHPKLATKPVDVPTKEELDILQDKFNDANTVANNARTEAGKLKGASDEKEESVKKEISSLLGDVSLDDAKSAIAVRVSDIDSLIDEIDAKIAETQDKIDRKEELDELLPEKTSALEKSKEELAQIKDEVKSKTIENASLEKRITELKAKLTLETKLDAENQIETLNKEAESIQKAYANAMGRPYLSATLDTSLKLAVPSKSRAKIC